MLTLQEHSLQKRGERQITFQNQTNFFLQVLEQKTPSQKEFARKSNSARSFRSWKKRRSDEEEAADNQRTASADEEREINVTARTYNKLYRYVSYK